MGSLVLAIVIIVCARWFFRSGLADAMADSIRKRHGLGPDQALGDRYEELAEHLDEQVGALRNEVMELSERVEFTERALVQSRNTARFPGPSSPLDRPGSSTG